MSDIDVRHIRDAELAAYVTAMEAGFHHLSQEGIVDWLGRHIETERTIAAFDGDDVVGTARSFETELTVTGGERVPVGAVTEVTVTATHRRQGLLTRMMDLQRDELVGRGYAAAILIAAEAPIYGRFGYGMATEDVYLEVRAPNKFTVPTPPGSVRRCTPAEFVAVAPEVYDRYRHSQPGAIERKPLFWDYFVNRPPGEEKAPGEEFAVIRRDPSGAADGYARYRIKSDWRHRMPDGKLTIKELVANTDDAYIALWQHCTSVDWVRTVAGGRPLVEPLPFMVADRRTVVQNTRGDFLWLRLLDPVAALSARRYRVADRLVLRVRDGFGGVADGTFVVDGGPDGASCAATEADPDLTVDVADLGATYLGGTALWPAATAGRVIEHRLGALARFDTMFGSDVAPYCNTDF